ncbi:MAG: c-type cytochrome biogenesis protein CcsB [Actinobacteria bacterium]|nr:c-type cytochrome biogenesis protein CcsB [Actinomycetota bacterium]
MSVNQTYAELSNMFVYGAMAVYTFAMFAFAASFAQGRDKESNPLNGRKSGNIAMSLSWLGTVVLAGGVLLRGLSAGRVPWGNMYEFSITGTFGVMAVLLVYSLKKDVRWFGLFIILPALLSLGLAVTVLYTESAQLIPALKSYWLLIHVSAAVVSAGMFAIGGVLTILQLLVDREERRLAEGLKPSRMQAITARVPNSQELDLLSYKVHAFVFPLWTFTVVAGAIWARSAWGRYWGWDPKETWAFVTWVGYAAYLHARITVGWKGNRAAYIALIAFLTFIFNYFFVNFFFAGLHVYSGK